MQYPIIRRSLTLVLLSLLCLAAGPLPASADLRSDYRNFFFENRAPVPLNPRLLQAYPIPGLLVVERVRISTEAGHNAVALIIRPARVRRNPTVLVQHHTGGRKEDPIVVAMLTDFARRGYTAVAIDGRYRGERANGKTLVQAVDETLRTGVGRPWLADTVYDLIRTIDYLQTRADVDPGRIGMVGFSEGGLETWMAAAADQRIQVAVPMLGVTRFQYIARAAAAPSGAAFRQSLEPALLNFARQIGETQVNERVMREAIERLLPGFQGRSDPINVVLLIAPRPLLILNHEKDEIIPLQGALEVYAATRIRYAQHGRPDRIRLIVAPNATHAAFVPREITDMYNWMDHFLKFNRL